MYIENTGHYIGGTDNSLTLVGYLKDKQKTEFFLNEIFADTGLDKLNETVSIPQLSWGNNRCKWR